MTTKIESVRLLNALLSIKKSIANTGIQSAPTGSKDSTGPVLVRNISELEMRIKQSLNAGYTAGGGIENLKKIVIAEIILWEFGEEIVNHPEFRYVSNFVENVINSNDILERSLRAFANEFVTVPNK